MPGPVTDPRAGALLRRDLERFGGSRIFLPIESIAEGRQVLEGSWPPVFCHEVEAGDNGHLPLEREANVFAAELLTPMEAVRDVFRENDSIDVTAARFGVSAPAMHWRPFNVDLVAERPMSE